MISGAQDENRTHDLRITSALCGYITRQEKVR